MAPFVIFILAVAFILFTIFKIASSIVNKDDDSDEVIRKDK